LKVVGVFESVFRAPLNNNLGKGSMTHVEMIMFCKLIRDNWNNVD
jgi:hypothetical protein